MYDGDLTVSYFPALARGEVPAISIGEALSSAAELAGGVPALLEARADGTIGRRWTYRQLSEDALRLARVLLDRHHPEDRIAIWAPNSPEWVLLEYAAAYAGLPVVTVNPSFTAREVEYILGQSGASALYCVESFRGNPIGRIAMDVVANNGRVRNLIDLQDWDNLFDANGGSAHELPLVQPRDLAQIQYTSGTTGFPKGALLHHEGLYGNARFVAERLGLGREDIWLNFMPMFHTGGCGVATLGSLSARATMIIAQSFDPMIMNRIIANEGVTHFLGVPTMIAAMVEALQPEPRKPQSIKGILAGGAIVSPELARRSKAAFGVIPQIIFGQTESSPVQTMTWVDDDFQDATETVGQPLPHVEVTVIDPMSGSPVALNSQGEICVRSFMNMIGYNDNVAATAEAIDCDGWLHTGDLGSMDSRGYVRVTGRMKDMIIRGGENIFPAEIENVMIEHPLISEVAVVGVKDDKFGEVAACFIRSSEKARLDPSELVAFCRSRLSAQKTPNYWINVDEWPLTGSGKVQKFILRERFEAALYANSTL